MSRKTRRRAWCFGLLMAAAFAIAAQPSSAQDLFKKTPEAEAAPDWIVTVGGTLTSSPLFEGAGKYGLSGLPSLSFRRANEPEDFGAPDDSLDYTLFGTSGFKAGAVVNLRSGRSAHDDARLSGLNNYPWAIEPGGFIEIWPIENRLRTRLEIRHGLHANDGFVADLSMDLVQKFGAFTLSGGPRLTLADSSVMQKEFGVSPLASQHNGLLPPFQARGGAKSIGLEAAISYDWSDQWRTTVFQRYDRLIGDAAASPITTHLGSKNQFTFGVGLTYAFKMNSF
jgi:outer membrane scaffolding protein for murein synthesis (MipA/OmpV family)